MNIGSRRQAKAMPTEQYNKKSQPMKWVEFAEWSLFVWWSRRYGKYMKCSLRKGTSNFSNICCLLMNYTFQKYFIWPGRFLLNSTLFRVGTGFAIESVGFASAHLRLITLFPVQGILNPIDMCFVWISQIIQDFALKITSFNIKWRLSFSSIFIICYELMFMNVCNWDRAKEMKTLANHDVGTILQRRHIVTKYIEE